MSDIPSFAKLVPGFDFLENLAKNAGSALPGIGQWVAPTLNPDELRKRIDELKTVQFWLEQNAKMLGATIQALEVQRMTLSTLKTMNVQMGDLREAMKIPTMPALDADAMMQATRQAMGGVGLAAKPAPEAAAAAPESTPAAATEPAAAGAGVVDPMQWWNALTKQFTQLATSAMTETAADAARNLAGRMLNPGADAAAAKTPPAAEAGPASRKPAAKKRTATAAKTRAR